MGSSIKEGLKTEKSLAQHLKKKLMRKQKNSPLEKKIICTQEGKAPNKSDKNESIISSKLDQIFKSAESESKTDTNEKKELSILQAKLSTDLQNSFKIPEKKEFLEIDMNTINSVEDLLKLGPDHLKHELTRLGLKCGGNLQERANRLYDIKLNPQLLFNPKYLAKKQFINSFLLLFYHNIYYFMKKSFSDST